MKCSRSLVVGSVVSMFAVMPTASADPAAVSYEIMMNGKEFVCGYFDTQGANQASLNSIGQFYINKGFSPAESAEIVSTSVQYWCKGYLPALHVASTNSSADTPSPTLSDEESRYVAANGTSICYLIMIPNSIAFTQQIDLLQIDGWSYSAARRMVISSINQYCPEKAAAYQ